MLKIGLIGAGHLGKIHLKLIQELSEYYDLVGFYDEDKENSAQVSAQFNVKSFGSINELLQQVDCVDIVTPTFVHFASAVESLRMRKHVFIEKPLSQTIEEARKLVALTSEADVKVQVGHV